MDSTEQGRLEAELAAAVAELARLREENAALEEKDRPAINAARARVTEARARLAVWKKTGASHGVVAEGGQVIGTVAVRLPPGMSSKERERAIDDALAGMLGEAVDPIGVVLAAEPVRYAQERRGRDAEGRTIFEVAGRVEGDRLVPAISRASKLMRKN